MKILAMNCLKVAVLFGNCGGELLPPPGNTALSSNEYTFFRLQLMPENCPEGSISKKSRQMLWCLYTVKLISPWYKVKHVG